MRYEWDKAKRAENIAKHGVDFAEAKDFDRDAALAARDYGEVRYRAIGPIGPRLYVMAFTARRGTVRIISPRKANPREVKGYGEKTR